jgi:hypothetical protein
MEVHLDRLHIPASTKWAVGLMFSGVAGLVLWNLLTTLAIKESQATDNREVWIQFGKHEARMDVQDVRYEALKSQVEELKERR